MLSYLETVKKCCPTEIYNRGLRAYLEGKIISQQAMVLDFWRVYKVEDREIYTVQIPLLHLALSLDKHSLASKALQEVVSCDCNYFQEFGVCKHITAVCASLEDEFSISLKKQKRGASSSASQVFDSILEVGIEKKIRQFLVALEDFLEVGYSNLSFLQDFILEVKTDPKYQTTLKQVQALLLEKIENYEYERKILKLVQPSLILDAENWWSVWHKIQAKLTAKNRLKFFSQVWKSYLAGNLESIQAEFKTALQNLAELDKLEIFEFLQKEYEAEAENWLEFAILAQMQSWIVKNLNLLDPLFLLKVIQAFPDIRETAEIHLLEQLKLWSDFLETGQNYDEIIQVFDIWQKELGGSIYCEEALDYFKQNHPKKKKLFKNSL